MTPPHHAPHSPPRRPPSPADAAISTAVQQLLDERGESVVDLAHFSRISVAALYRKLHGQARWWAADVATIAEHYGVRPGALYTGERVLGEQLLEDPAPATAAAPAQDLPRSRSAPAQQRVDPLAQPFSDPHAVVAAPLV